MYETKSQFCDTINNEHPSTVVFLDTFYLSLKWHFKFMLVKLNLHEVRNMHFLLICPLFIYQKVWCIWWYVFIPHLLYVLVTFGSNFRQVLTHVGWVLTSRGLSTECFGHRTSKTRHVTTTQSNNFNTQRLALFSELCNLAAQPGF